jgi:hypothetical protein
VSENRSARFGGNAALGPGAWQAGSTNTLPANAQAVPVIVGGVARLLAINLVGHPWQPAMVQQLRAQPGGTTRLYALLVDQAGAVTMTAGPDADTARLAAGVEALQMPPVLGERACVGMVRVSLTPGPAFTPGVMPLTTSGNRAVSFINAATVSAEPLRA